MADLQTRRKISKQKQDGQISVGTKNADVIDNCRTVFRM
jgi:hypothetical protein